MRYLHKLLKGVGAGIKIKVDFDKPVKILLMNPEQYRRYKGGCSYTYYGGPADEAPGYIVIPKAGDWNIVVETGGYYEDRKVTVKLSLASNGENHHKAENQSTHEEKSSKKNKKGKKGKHEEDTESQPEVKQENPE